MTYPGATLCVVAKSSEVGLSNTRGQEECILHSARPVAMRRPASISCSIEADSLRGKTGHYGGKNANDIAPPNVQPVRMCDG